MTGLIPRTCPHCNGPLDIKRLVEWGGWTLDEELRRLSPSGAHPLSLTAKESELLGTLLRAGGRLVERDGGLYSIICGDRAEEDWPNIELVDVFVCKLRKKLHSVYGRNVLINTVWGTGYHAVPFVMTPVVRTRR